MRKSIKHQIWLGITTMSLVVGVLAVLPSNANAALKWHKGTPSILSGKKYRDKRSPVLSPNGTHYEWVKGTKSTFHYYGFQWPGLKTNDTSYKKSGHTYMIRGKSTAKYDKRQYQYLKIKQISSKKIRIATGTVPDGSKTPIFTSYYTMTRF